MKRILFAIILILTKGLLISGQSLNSSNSNLEILVPTGEVVNDLYVFKKASLTDTVASGALNAANKTFIGESSVLFNYVQTYLYNLGITKEPEPPRLAITNRQGCYGVMGFVLDENGKKIEKPHSGYVDLYKGMFSSGYSNLESITQLFPHEMGHVIQMYLCTGFKNMEPESKSPNMHYFNITTCYNTAFSEGFAEHFENIARKLEPSQNVKAGIFKDIEANRKALPRYISGFDRDYRLPLRIGFYRAITPLWYQQLENLKRYDLVENGQIKYVNSIIPHLSVSNAILYRNTGVRQNRFRLRNAAQAASTEGVVSAFFSGLVLSSLSEKYLAPGFYTPFTNDSLSVKNLKFKIIPLHNEYMKIFKVLQKYVKTNSTERGQLFDFANGYCREFPDESAQLKEILRETTGVTVIPGSLPEVWVLNTSLNYKYWPMAQFGLTVPYYAFNLNAADSLDLITFDGITGEDASKITGYRERYGFFQSTDEIKKVPGLSEKAKTTIISNTYSEKNVPVNNGRPDFMSLLYLPLFHMSVILMAWFAIILALYLYLTKDFELTFWQRIWKSILQLLKFFSLAFIGLISIALFSFSWKLFIVIGVIIMGIKMIILRKKKPELKVSLIITSIMIVVILYSLL
jgi:Helix-hairpin-helix motif